MIRQFLFSFISYVLLNNKTGHADRNSFYENKTDRNRAFANKSLLSKRLHLSFRKK